MHVYSVLRSPFAFPCVPWNFEVGNATDEKLEVGELRSPASYYTLTTGCKPLNVLFNSMFFALICRRFILLGAFIHALLSRATLALARLSCYITATKSQSNLSKGDIAPLIMTSGTAHGCLVDIFYHIR